MDQTLFNLPSDTNDDARYIGQGLYLKFRGVGNSLADLYRNGVLIRTADMSDKTAKRLFVVEAVELGATQIHLACALNISRQTIHNYLETKKHFGIEGLIRNYNPATKPTLRQNREAQADQGLIGNKARQLEQMRKQQREELDAQQGKLPFGDRTIAPEDQPFAEVHDWQKTRYAGVFCYLITLIYLYDWAKLAFSYLGDKYKLLFTFVLMVANNIRSIEQLKNVHRREAGAVLGIGQTPDKTKARTWLYCASKLKIAGQLLFHFSLRQICCGIVNTWLWFVDGHLLPYTGKQKVHQAFNTQRAMMTPGRSNIVVCDSSGRVVDFEIQEGQGDLREYLIRLGSKWKDYISTGPVLVFDREGYGAEFFAKMTRAGVDFVTWEKHIDTAKLKSLEDDLFTEEFTFNGKLYRVFESQKQFNWDADGQESEITLRLIHIWNVSSNRRTCALSNVATDKMDTMQCAQAILSRWGASENSFKHLQEKHPLNYQPGYSFTESQNQQISNPEVKKFKKLVSTIKASLVALYKKLSKSSESLNKDGSVRKNSARQGILTQIEKKESEVEALKEEAKELPERVDVSMLEDYTSFGCICDESKYLFDFVTASVWNGRKQMVEWLLPLYGNQNEYVDLFYAITNCHGWIKSDARVVTVRLEPLQQPSRLAAQIQFCRKLSQLKVITPSGKLLQIEVGDCPFG